ncbi:aldehyde dehydrogenase family protein [Agrococcus versicolor]|uniref:Aldehyde dehydrogenase family protein n=1 Tax=Agrococcus versicolor TaxID=501482 RepID=A0ABN3AIT7_9MICO
MTDRTIPEYGAFIDGRFRELGPVWFEAREAATGEILARLTRSGPAEVDDAVEAADRAFPAWAALTAEHRAALLMRFAAAIEENAETLARLESVDTGRHIREMREDYAATVTQLRYFASVVLAHEGFGRQLATGYLVAKRVPLGVCGQIIPWNDPAVMMAFKIAPALAAGNTVVLKPDRNASVSVMEITRLAADIFPPGVLNVVPGYGTEVGSALTAHPKVRKLAFTGSTETGRTVAEAGASRLVSSILELGGKSPSIVFPDIEDMDAVVANATFGVLMCNGQSCLAGTRLFVHADIYDRFLELLVARFESLQVGPPLDETTDLSGMIHAEHAKKVLSMIEAGIAEGARLVTGGHRAHVPGFEQGNFIEPTILEATNAMSVAREEIFGPVLCVIRWDDYETMIAEANDTPYGLASGIYTSNLRHAMDTADRLDAGSVWINEYFNLSGGVPFGGFKDSGLGREFCFDTLNEYTQLKSITIATSTKPAA